MEENTLHRAADTLNELLLAHISDDSREIDIYDAIAVRDDIREMAYESEESREFDLPKVGQVMHDPDHIGQYGCGDVEVVEVLPDVQCNEFNIQDGSNRSVSYMNPEYADDAPVVRATYVEGSDKVYAFPSTRLE